MATSFEQRIRDLQALDAFVRERKWQAFPDGQVTTAPHKGKWTVGSSGIVRKDGAVYVLKDLAIRVEILRVNYNNLW